jgi:hypothetical protein
MTEDPRKKQWESLRDQNKALYDSTGDDFLRIRYEACKRLLGEEDEKKEDPQHFA